MMLLRVCPQRIIIFDLDNLLVLSIQCASYLVSLSTLLESTYLLDEVRIVRIMRYILCHGLLR